MRQRLICIILALVLNSHLSSSTCERVLAVGSERYCKSMSIAHFLDSWPKLIKRWTKEGGENNWPNLRGETWKNYMYMYLITDWGKGEQVKKNLDEFLFIRFHFVLLFNNMQQKFINGGYRIRKWGAYRILELFILTN